MFCLPECAGVMQVCRLHCFVTIEAEDRPDIYMHVDDPPREVQRSREVGKHHYAESVLGYSQPFLGN